MLLKVVPICLLFVLSESLPTDTLKIWEDKLLGNPGKEGNRRSRDASPMIALDSECGALISEGVSLRIGGNKPIAQEVPWHAGIYTKTKQPYMQLCTGSLVKNTVVLSAAHCFWSETDKQLPAANYAVAVGKLYRPWSDPHDQNSQKSDVKEIHLPNRFFGAATNYQDDIAVLVMASAFEYTTHVHPVCLNFDLNLEQQQLQPGKIGKMASWSLSDKGAENQVLKVAELPYMDIQQCFQSSPSDFREFITSDKICTGYQGKDTKLCPGAAGGGLAFPELVNGQERYFLRGIASAVPRGETLCNAVSVAAFTLISKHEQLITKYV